jgi:hypothetical protein
VRQPPIVPALRNGIEPDELGDEEVDKNSSGIKVTRNATSFAVGSIAKMRPRVTNNGVPGGCGTPIE